MKRQTALITFLLGISLFLSAQRVIKMPDYEFRSSGICSITKIERQKEATRIHVLCQFVPHWWVKFDQNTHVIDTETGKRYDPIAIEGTEFGKETYIPDSGDTTLVFVYPPFDKKMKKFNWQEEGSDGAAIYGVSLNKPGKRAKATSEENLFGNWPGMEELLAEKQDSDFDPTFFKSDTAHIRGYIKGYDPRAGFKTGIIYTENMLSREDYPTVITIHPDGRFEADFPLNHPSQSNFYMKENRIPFYIEPGETLFVHLDWEDFLQRDRFRNRGGSFPHTQYAGASAQVNKELSQIQLKEADFYNNYKKIVETVAPADFKQQQLRVYQETRDSLSHQLAQQPFSLKTQKLMKNQIAMEMATILFDYDNKRSYMTRQDTTNQVMKIPLPADYFDFLQMINWQDKSLPASSKFSVFINRFEFMDAFRQKAFNPHPIITKTFWEYATEQEKDLQPKDRDLVNYLLNFSKKTFDEVNISKDEKAKLQTQMEDFLKRNSILFQDYNTLYVEPSQKEFKQKQKSQLLDTWAYKDSVRQHQLRLPAGDAFDITKTRSLSFGFGQMERDDALTSITKLNKGISDPFLQQEGIRLFEKLFPSAEKQTYKLPEGKATDIFRKIADPHKGKYVLVDFWATSCGPCRGGIENMRPIREKYKDSPDFTFVYITDTGSSPEGVYNKFVGENAMGENLHRLPEDEYNYLRQLFKFNGIPRYVLLNRDGDVVDDDFPAHNLVYELSKIFTK